MLDLLYALAIPSLYSHRVTYRIMSVMQDGNCGHLPLRSASFNYERFPATDSMAANDTGSSCDREDDGHKSCICICIVLYPIQYIQYGITATIYGTRPGLRSIHRMHFRNKGGTIPIILKAVNHWRPPVPTISNTVGTSVQFTFACSPFRQFPSASAPPPSSVPPPRPSLRLD